VTETAVPETKAYLEEEHGEADVRSAGLVREDHPELDEALDPEFEPAFELEADPELEKRDLHEADEELEAEPTKDLPKIAPRSERTIPGMGGKVFDYRGTGLCPPNGGRIRPLLMVHHIPVVPNMTGTRDLVRLGDILRRQGLAIQAATDAGGNVALYTQFDVLCFGHRGANQIACGIEHMHFRVDEPWTEKQMRAAAWCAVQVWVAFGIPPRGAVLGRGNPVVTQRRGHTTHKLVSDLAGFNDRSDPGAGFNFPHLYELTRFFRKHHRF
jgi:N-acetylmuramoyl-L-alanine amidase